MLWQGFPVAFRAAWCAVAFCCVSRLEKLISLVCCEEGRRCTQRSQSSSARDTWIGSVHREQGLPWLEYESEKEEKHRAERERWLEGELQACTQS